ncbi:MAG: S49 family peptidase [Pseudomonadota bacterium]
MPHEIDRVLALAAGSTWLIEPLKAAQIAAALALRAEGQTGFDGDARPPLIAMDPVQGQRGTVHVLRIHGTIMPRADMMMRFSGGVSMQSFMKAFKVAADDANASAIVLDVNSPGGIVDFVPEAAETVYQARRAERPIIAVANTAMHSAAYFLASAADEIVVTPSGAVGSIGVRTAYDDFSQALEMAGISRTVIAAAPRKHERVFGPMDEAAEAHLRAEVNAAYEKFVAAVARNRQVDASVVRADPEAADRHFGGGRGYHAEEAVRLGLADRVETFDEALTRAASGQPSRRRRTATARARLALI